VTAVPYAEDFPERSVAVAAAAPVVLIELGLTGIHDGRDRIGQNDLLFLYW
jgi:hypothetical protein